MLNYEFMKKIKNISELEKNKLDKMDLPIFLKYILYTLNERYIKKDMSNLMFYGLIRDTLDNYNTINESNIKLEYRNIIDKKDELHNLIIDKLNIIEYNKKLHIKLKFKMMMLFVPKVERKILSSLKNIESTSISKNVYFKKRMMNLLEIKLEDIHDKLYLDVVELLGKDIADEQFSSEEYLMSIEKNIIDGWDGAYSFLNSYLEDITIAGLKENDGYNNEKYVNKFNKFIERKKKIEK